MRQAHIMGAIAALAATSLAEPGASGQAPKEIAITHRPPLIMLPRTAGEGDPPASIRYRRKGKKAWKALRRIRG